MLVYILDPVFLLLSFLYSVTLLSHIYLLVFTHWYSSGRVFLLSYYKLTRKYDCLIIHFTLLIVSYLLVYRLNHTIGVLLFAKTAKISEKIRIIVEPFGDYNECRHQYNFQTSTI